MQPKANDEFIRRLGEPEPLRSLRLQKERLEHERTLALKRMLADQEAEAIRGEIRRMGEEPCG